MLEMITEGFKKAQLKLQGKTIIQEKHIEEAIRDIRVSLLEADVEFHVVKGFTDRVRAKALGEIVQTKVRKKTQGRTPRTFHKDMLR